VFAIANCNCNAIAKSVFDADELIGTFFIFPDQPISELGLLADWLWVSS